jgi:hypothetical protein
LAAVGYWLLTAIDRPNRFVPPNLPARPQVHEQRARLFVLLSA